MKFSLCYTLSLIFCSPSGAQSDVFEVNTDDALSLLQLSAARHEQRPNMGMSMGMSMGMGMSGSMGMGMAKCQSGLRSGRFCCGGQCGQCGGRGCQNRPGGRDSCCTTRIRSSGRRCSGNMQNCLMPRNNRRRNMGMGMGGEPVGGPETPEPQVPPTDITEPIVIEELALCETSLAFQSVIRNNLGGAGPDAGEEGILFGAVAPGTDLLVSATSSYTPNMLNPSGGVLRNGVHRKFGVINLAP